jgi:diguanylate cyclase (GGDEF)-like protein
MNSSEMQKTLEFHACLAEKTATTSDLHLLIESIISETITFMEAHSGSIMVFDHEANSLKLYVSSHHPGIKAPKTKGPVAFVPLDQGIASRVFRNGKPMLAKDLEQESGKPVLKRRKDDGSFLSLPLMINQKVIGVLNLNRTETSKGFSQHDLDKLRFVDTLIASLIEKENFLSTIEANREEIAGLYAMTSILSQASDFTGRLEEFLGKLSEQLSLEKSAIIKMQTDNGSNTLNEGAYEILAAHNLKPAALHKLFSSVSHQLKNQLENSVFSASGNSSDQPPTLTFQDKNGLSDLFCLPLIVEGQSSHMLLVSRQYKNDDIEEVNRHYRFLYLVSKNLSMAIERENMVERIRENQDILLENALRNRVFLEISKDLASTLDPYTILQKAFDQFRKIIRFTTISILLYDDLDNVYRLIVQPAEPISDKYKTRLTETVYAVFSEYPATPPLSPENFHKATYFNESGQTSRPAEQFQQTLHLPVIISEKVCGLIHLARKHNQPFSNQELDITSQFTGIFITSIKNAMIHKRTEKLAFTDPLTELFNHRYFQETLSHEFTRARRYTKPLSLMVIDIDFFKKFNDTYGHLVGDKVLRHVAHILRNSVREQIDTVARYGGEEFVVILPETMIEGAAQFAERIRLKVEQSRVIEDGQELSVKLSIGVSCTLITSCEKTSDLIEAADIALYQAKENGRNQVRIYTESRINHEK